MFFTSELTLPFNSIEGISNVKNSIFIQGWRKVNESGVATYLLFSKSVVAPGGTI